MNGRGADTDDAAPPIRKVGPVPRRCRLIRAPLELLDAIIRTPDHFQLPRDAKLVGMAESPRLSEAHRVFGLLFCSETFDWIPEGKQWPVINVPFVQKVVV